MANPANAQFIQEKEKKEQNELPFVVQQYIAKAYSHNRSSSEVTRALSPTTRSNPTFFFFFEPRYQDGRYPMPRRSERHGHFWRHPLLPCHIMPVRYRGHILKQWPDAPSEPNPPRLFRTLDPDFRVGEKKRCVVFVGPATAISV